MSATVTCNVDRDLLFQLSFNDATPYRQTILRRSNKYKLSQRTSAGSDKWLVTKVWTNTKDCLESARAAGYQIVATHLSKSSTTIQVTWRSGGQPLVASKLTTRTKGVCSSMFACAKIESCGQDRPQAERCIFSGVYHP